MSFQNLRLFRLAVSASTAIAFSCWTTVTTAKEVHSTIGGTVTYNGVSKTITGSLVENGEISGSVAATGGCLWTGPFIIPPWLNELIKARPTGLELDPWILTTVGDTASVNIDLGTYGSLHSDISVTAANPLTMLVTWSGTETYSLADADLPWQKVYNITFNANGTITGNATLRANVPGSGMTEIAAAYSGTFSAAHPEVAFPAVATGTFDITSVNTSTGAWSGSGHRTLVPTVSTWGLAVLALLVLTAATIVIMRRRVAQAA